MCRHCRRLAKAAARRGNRGRDGESGDEESGEDYWSDSEEEEEVSSPIDALDPFIYFAGEDCCT